MRICQSIMSNPWAGLAGGGQQSAHRMALAMAELGHEVHAIYSRLPHEAPDEEIPYRIHWTKFREPNGLNMDFISHGAVLRKLLSNRKFDLVLCHSLSGAFFPSLCHRHGVALHGILHAPRLPEAAPWYRWNMRDWDGLNSHILRSLLERCDALHVFSGFTGELASRLVRAGQPRIHRSTLGIEAAWCGCAGERVVQPGARGIRGINWGRFERGKGHEALIDSFAALRALGYDARLTLIGDGSHGPAVRAYGRARLGDAVSFTGTLDGAQIRAHLPGADVAVFLSEMESFGLAIAEASASGIPTFAGSVGGVADALSQGRGGTLVTPATAEALTANLLHFLDMPAPFLDAARAGVDIGMTRSWRATALSMLDILDA